MRGPEKILCKIDAGVSLQRLRARSVQKNKGFRYFGIRNSEYMGAMNLLIMVMLN